MLIARKNAVVGLFALSLAACGCGTEPSGGKLPPAPPKQSADQAKADFSKMTGEMYSEMAKQGTPGAPGPRTPKTK